MKKEVIKKLILMTIAALTTANMHYTSASAEWVKDSKNNWSWIENKSKVTGWKEIDKNWYYFNDNGRMCTGWIKYSSNWYNLSGSGEMLTGWKEIDEKWYHFNNDGKMSIGWINDNGTWYFTNSSGEMETGTITIDGKTYDFSQTGAMLSGKEIVQQAQPGVGDIKNTDNSRIAYVSTSDGLLNIRAKATTSSDIIGTLAKGTEVKILGDKENEFYPIVINGKEGWISSKWIIFERPQSTPPIVVIGPEDTNNTNVKEENDNIPPIDSGKKDDSMDDNVTDDSLKKGKIRDTAPSMGNKYYYSDDNLFYKVRLSPPFLNGGKEIKGNCTWYAWGRAWELTGIKPVDAGFIGNGYEWWEANKKSGKYQYGSQPRVGAIAVWKSSLPGSSGSGHVAVVEKISGGKIYISESTWHGAAFRYREIYETSYLYGYIYLDEPNY
ncbi:CHAP domain-containing protein [Clostridium chromiireducens]|uniref:N-acetylmuramoyl-L-alanine amidase n=1 Tax=Clostridium chromiireducens TaxID=225345 RepID=A0A1V4J107_9CLOT|nr:CHAP domain-containing protein [Clostridium chromiireducens]MVX64348.1 CHAP domain-containing protein [Clostridium chromiireducens]OPJ65694.1 autolysin [Clostridium chromiireducens]RII32092.1 CHAP domain-containing protein [Clostridium chromiireducens]